MAETAEGEFARYSDAELLFIRDFLQRGREVLAAHTERVRDLPPRSTDGDA